MTTWDLSGTQHHLLICNGDTCMQHGGDAVTLAIRKAISELDAHDLIHTTRTRCNGRCEDACVVIAYPEGVWYRAVSPEIGQAIVREHLLGGCPLSQHQIYTYAGELIPNGHAVRGVPKKRRKSG